MQIFWIYQVEKFVSLVGRRISRIPAESIIALIGSDQFSGTFVLEKPNTVHCQWRQCRNKYGLYSLDLVDHLEHLFRLQSCQFGLFLT